MKHPSNYSLLFPKKNFGQNFLISSFAVTEIINHSLIKKEDYVLEIGPGLGILTEEIIPRAKKTFAIEKDRRMVNFLNSEFRNYINEGRLEIIEADATKVDFKNFFNKNKFKVISNLPYNVAIPILFNLYKQKDSIRLMILMFQKEVAERIIAKPGEKKFNVLSVNTQMFAEIYKVLNLTPEDFFPKPKVNSTVLSFNFFEKPKYHVSDYDFFQVLVKAAFCLRRRKVINSIKASGKIRGLDLEKIFYDLGIDSNKRAEAITLEEWSKLANKILDSMA